MPLTDYQKRIVDYYEATENAYRDSWDLDNSLSIHYGYWDERVRSFPQSLIRMNEVMMETAKIKEGERVLDAGCGVGGSAIYLAQTMQGRITGITLSPRQAAMAAANARRRGVAELADFQVQDYCQTDFPGQSFDIVWGCESICYAGDKQAFIREAWRLLRPGGRLIVADGFVSDFSHNQDPLIRQWLDGWQVNYLETPERFSRFMEESGFRDIRYRDISAYTARSVARLHRFYYLARLYVTWKKLTLSNRATDMQLKNIRACKYQHLGRKNKLWQYGIIVGVKS